MRRRTRYILLFLVVIIIGGFIARARFGGPTVKSGSYLLLEINGSYEEAAPEDLVGRLLRRRERTLMDVLTQIRKAQVDERIKGIIARIGGLDIGWAKIQDLRDAFAEFKGSGKPLLAVIEQEGGGSNKEYYLASASDRVYLSPNATASLNGLEGRFLFLGGVWEKLDIDMHVEKIREYKTAGDMLANKEMTPEHREMANSILDSVNAQFIAGLAHGRGLQPEAVQALIDQCPVMPSEFEAAHLTNGTRYVQDLHDEIGGADVPLVDVKDYTQVSARRLGLDIGPQIAVVYGVGPIISGEGGSSVQGDMMGADTVSHALKDAADDEAVRAIVFRVDSPGGSALASDLVWRATQEARKKKPLIVSMSDVAGSGGYYIAAGATKIVAQPATMTGSIGVVFARPNVKGLLARLGVTTESIGRGTYSQLDDLTTPLSPEGREKLVAEMDHIYDVFVERVATGRNLTRERVNEIGRGRVWTGAQAKDNGLVDELGGFRAAIQTAKQAAGIAPTQEVELIFFPKRKALLERLGEMLSSRAVIELPRPWRTMLAAAALPFEEGALLTLMPEVIDVH